MILPIVEKETRTRGVLEGREYVSFDRENLRDTLTSVVNGLHSLLVRKFEETQRQQSSNVVVAIGALLFLGLLLAAFSD